MRRKSTTRGRTSAGRFPSGTPTSATTSASDTAVELSANSEDESTTQITDAEMGKDSDGVVKTESVTVTESGDQSPLKLMVTSSQSEESITTTKTAANPPGKTTPEAKVEDAGELDVTAESQDMILADSDTEPDVRQSESDDILLIDSDDGNEPDKTGKVSESDGTKPAGYVTVPSQAPAKDDDDMVEFMKSLGLKGATGFLELSIGGAPPIHVVAAETRPFRALRRVVVRDVRPSDLGHSILLELTASNMCNHVRLECDRLKHDVNSWTGELEIYFGTAATAILATEALRGLRDGVAVDYGNIPAVEKPSSPEQSKLLEYEMKPWSDLIVIVKNIGVTTDETKAKLSELFPDADVVLHKDGTSEVIKGQAYLLFASKELADNAIQTFRRKQFRLDGKRLILIRWDPQRLLPDGMLRVGERRLLMLTMLQMEARLAKGGAPLLTAKYKALGEIVARDTKTRRACGFPAPSYNQLKGLYDVRNYSDAETALILKRLLTPYGCAGPDETASENPPPKPTPKPAPKVQPAAAASPAAKPTTPVAGAGKPAPGKPVTPASGKPATVAGGHGKPVTPSTPVGKPATAPGGKPITPAAGGAGKPAVAAGGVAGRNAPVKPTTAPIKTEPGKLPEKLTEKAGTGTEKGKMPDGKETKVKSEMDQKPERSDGKTSAAGKTDTFKKNSQDTKKSFGAGRDTKPSPSSSERPGSARSPGRGGRGGRHGQKITSLLSLNVSKPGPNAGPGLLGMFPSPLVSGSQQQRGLLSTPVNMLPAPPQPTILPLPMPAAALLQRPLSPPPSRRSPPMKRGNRDGLLGSYPGEREPSPGRSGGSKIPSLLSDLNEPRPKLMRYDDERDSRRSRFDTGDADRYGRRSRDGSPPRSAGRDQRSDGYERGAGGAKPGVVSIFDLGDRHSRGGAEREQVEQQYIKPLLGDYRSEDRRDGRSGGTPGQRDASHQSGPRYQEAEFREPASRGRDFEGDRGFVVSDYRHAGDRSWQDTRDERPSTDSRYAAAQYDRGEVRPLFQTVDDRRADSQAGNLGGSNRSGMNSGYDDRRAMTSGNSERSSSAIPSIFDIMEPSKFDGRGSSSGAFSQDRGVQRSDGGGIPATSASRYDNYRGGSASRSGDVGAVSGMSSAYASGMVGSSAAYASGSGEEMSASYGMSAGGGNMSGYGASSAGVASLMDYGGASGRSGDWGTPLAGGSTRYDPAEPTGSAGAKRLTQQVGAQSDSPQQPDPVTLLMNLSQLLADKLQRDKDKGQRRDF